MIRLTFPSAQQVCVCVPGNHGNLLRELCIYHALNRIAEAEARDIICKAWRQVRSRRSLEIVSQETESERLRSYM